MSRFDGGKQGLGAWLVGLLVSLVAVALGAVAGSEYDIFERVDLPTLPLTRTSWARWHLAALVVLLATLLFAMAGGKVGTRYHAKVDRASRRLTDPLLTRPARGRPAVVYWPSRAMRPRRASSRRALPASPT